MRTWPRTFREVFKKNDQGVYVNWEAFDEELWYVTCDYFDARDATPREPQPPRPLALYFAARAVQDDVSNGGFAQVFINLPFHVDLAVEGMEEVGKPEAAALLREAIRRAIDVGDRLDEVRRGGIQAWSDFFREGIFYDLDDRMDSIGWYERRREEHDFIVRHRAVVEFLPRASEWYAR